MVKKNGFSLWCVYVFKCMFTVFRLCTPKRGFAFFGITRLGGNFITFKNTTANWLSTTLLNQVFSQRVMLKKLLLLFVLFSALHSSAQYYPFYNLGVENGLIQSQVRSITQDSNGHLWIGTLGGLSRYDGVTFTNYNVRDGLLDNACYAVTTDLEGNVWVGGNKGISCFNGSSFNHFKLQTNESLTLK